MIPPNNFWWFSRPPPPPLMSSFSKQIWVVRPLNPSISFSDPLFWILSYEWSPLLFSQKSSDPPQKSSVPTPPQVIINDRSFQCGDKVTSFLCFFDPCSAYYLCIVPVILFYYYFFFFGQVRVCEARYIAWQTRIVIVNNTLAPFLCLLDIRMRVCPRCKPRVY